MAGEIILVCKSINNKNVREGELKILRKFENELYFEFGESEINLKKRFYKDVETLNSDYKKLEELKEKSDNAAIEVNTEKIIESKIEKNIEEDTEEDKNKIKKATYNKKSIF